MKLATLKSNKLDGELIIVNKELSKAIKIVDIAPTLQYAIENWSQVKPQLNEKYQQLNQGVCDDVFDLNYNELLSPLPRAYQIVDGSAYLPHVERVRRARGAEMPPSFLHDPLMYQAVSDGTLGPREDIVVANEEFGIDFEAEVAIITDEVPMGLDATKAGKHIQLIMLMNDVSLRNLIPSELAKGFGFLQSKPRSAFSPVAITPDELGDAWQDYKVHLALHSHFNGEWFGSPEAGVDMQFNFAELIAHAAKTRPLAAGTIVGSGTIANQDESKGSSCIAERRVLEIIKHGKPTTPFMQFGDTIEIDMHDQDGNTIFGAIKQKVVAA